MTSRGMIRVFGNTYRIVENAEFHEIVRVLDDRRVGAFRHCPTVEIVDSLIDHGQLRAVIREVLRSARVSQRKTHYRGSLGQHWLRVSRHTPIDHQLSMLKNLARAWLARIRATISLREHRLQKSNAR